MYSKHDRFPRAEDPRRDDHRVMALCRQVQRTLSLSLAECHDEVLQNLLVQQVVPAPNAARLLALVSFTTPSGAVPLFELLARLERANGWLRREVAQAISRKRAPELSFALYHGEEVTDER